MARFSIFSSIMGQYEYFVSRGSSKKEKRRECEHFSINHKMQQNHGNLILKKSNSNQLKFQIFLC